uniref:Ribosomal protein S3 n=1 Tax=Dictyomenia sonderi TaxID=2007178 RepID=UPI0022FDA925|nr:Ribosomal protein S3 [Dictyomenia sonderi]WAX04248.1 Ribosomal protein S3 [Dictyomenia sonderi]
MSKKINQSGKCLALTTIWATQLQYYGKYSFPSKNIFFFIFLFVKIFNKQLVLNSTSFITRVHSFLFPTHINLVFSIPFISTSFFSNFYRFLFLIWNYNVNRLLSLKLDFYLEKNQYFSTSFLKSYILYLIYNKINSPRKIFNLLILLLKRNKSQLILLISKDGFKISKFIGFKIQLKGRYEITKNEMSSYLLVKNGKINSTNLNIKIHFMNHNFYTKLGTSNLKIWMFYSFK